MFKKSSKSSRATKFGSDQSPRGGGRGRMMRFSAPPGRGKKKVPPRGRPE